MGLRRQQCWKGLWDSCYASGIDLGRRPSSPPGGDSCPLFRGEWACRIGCPAGDRRLISAHSDWGTWSPVSASAPRSQLNDLTLLTSPGLPGTWEQRRRVLIIRPQASGLCLSQAGCAQVCKNRLPTPSARGWWDTHTISRPGLLGGKFLHLPIVIIKEIIIKTIHGGWTFCQRKRNSFQGTNTSPIERA